VKTSWHLWSYPAQFFLEWEMFQTKVVEKIKTHILCFVIFFRKSCHLWDNVKKYRRARQATYDMAEPDRSHMIWRMRFAYWIPKATYTHSKYVVLIAFPRQQWSRERASILRYTHIAFLVILSLVHMKDSLCLDAWLTVGSFFNVSPCIFQFNNW